MARPKVAAVMLLAVTCCLCSAAGKGEAQEGQQKVLKDTSTTTAVPRKESDGAAAEAGETAAAEDGKRDKRFYPFSPHWGARYPEDFPLTLYDLIEASLPFQYRYPHPSRYPGTAGYWGTGAAGYPHPTYNGPYYQPQWFSGADYPYYCPPGYHQGPHPYTPGHAAPSPGFPRDSMMTGEPMTGAIDVGLGASPAGFPEQAGSFSRQPPLTTLFPGPGSGSPSGPASFAPFPGTAGAVPGGMGPSFGASGMSPFGGGGGPGGASPASGGQFGGQGDIPGSPGQFFNGFPGGRPSRSGQFDGPGARPGNPGQSGKGGQGDRHVSPGKFDGPSGDGPFSDPWESSPGSQGPFSGPRGSILSSSMPFGGFKQPGSRAPGEDGKGDTPETQGSGPGATMLLSGLGSSGVSLNSGPDGRRPLGVPFTQSSKASPSGGDPMNPPMSLLGSGSPVSSFSGDENALRVRDTQVALSGDKAAVKSGAIKL